MYILTCNHLVNEHLQIFLRICVHILGRQMFILSRFTFCKQNWVFSWLHTRWFSKIVFRFSVHTLKRLYILSKHFIIRYMDAPLENKSSYIFFPSIKNDIQSIQKYLKPFKYWHKLWIHCNRATAS